MEAPYISLGSEPLSSALLSEVDVVQRLNDHWTCRIVLRDTPDRRPAVEDYAGKELKISTTELDGTETIIFHGLVRGMRLIYEITGAWGAELEAVSSTWKMAQGTRLKYYRQQSAQATAQAVISAAGLQMGGAMPGGATLSYVQWDETDYHFFSRLVDDAEAWFRPAVDGSGGVDVETGFQSGSTVNWREGEYGLLEWTTQGLLQPVTASGSNYDPQKMHSTVVEGTGSSVGWYGGAADKMVAAAQSASASVPAAWVDRHRAATLDDLDTRMQREARRGISNTVRCTGISRNPKVRAGDTLQVTGLPGVDATYGVIEVRHAWTTQGYENHFTVTPAQRWSPPVRPARPLLDGVYPARVVDNYDTHNQGRIRVQYYWQEDNQSTWVRLLTPHAGAGRGTLFLPEIGDEVLVTFEEGDAERPYVVGSAWNGVHQPPATGFHSPGETNGSEFEKNYIKRIVTKSGHRITLVDTPGKETISIATPTSNRIMLTESHADTGNRSAIVLESAGDIVMSAPNGRIHTQSMHRSAEVGGGAAPLLAAAAAASTLKGPSAGAAAPVAAVAPQAAAKKAAAKQTAPTLPPGCSYLSKGQRVLPSATDFDKNRQPYSLAKSTPTLKMFQGDASPSQGTSQIATIGGHAINIIRPNVPPAEKGTLVPSSGDIAKALGAVPANQLAKIKSVTVNSNRNPADAAWAKQYNIPNMRSEATSGAAGDVDFYPVPSASPMALDATFIHETAHTYSEQKWGADPSQWKEWPAAMKADGKSPSTYADASPAEDFSESMVMYTASKGTPCEQPARGLFPNRYQSLDKMLAPPPATKPSQPAAKPQPPAPKEQGFLDWLKSFF